ncbi:MAG: hypothetical protein OWU33_06095 [Firmicutes bacterium]|nr:hypothetical protein [Bacillota bacterium]
MATELLTDSKRRSWNRNLVIETIQYRHQQGMSLNPQRLQLDDPSLLAAGRRYFGSWPKALKAAKVPPVRRLAQNRHRRGYWTPDLLISEIRRHAEQGDPLYAHAMQKIDNCLVSAATYHFGSWAEALTAAGFDADAIRANRRYTEDSVLQEIQRLLAQNEDLRDLSARRAHRSLYWAARKFFGTWRTAVTLARSQANTAPDASRRHAT